MRGGSQTRVYYETPGQRLREVKERNAAGQMNMERLLLEVNAVRLG